MHHCNPQSLLLASDHAGVPLAHGIGRSDTLQHCARRGEIWENELICYSCTERTRNARRTSSPSYYAGDIQYGFTCARRPIVDSERRLHVAYASSLLIRLVYKDMKKSSTVKIWYIIFACGDVYIGLQASRLHQPASSTCLHLS